MINIVNPYSACDTCSSRCCKGNRSGRTPFFFKDEISAHKKPVYELHEDNPENTRYWCKYIQEGRCTIYEKRSLICRTFPIYPTYDNDKVCIGISLLCDVGLSYAAGLVDPVYRSHTLEDLEMYLKEFKAYLNEDELDKLCKETQKYKYRLIVHI